MMERGAARKVHHAVVAGAAGELGRAFLRRAFDQNPLDRADHCLADRARLRVELLLETLQPSGFLFQRELIGQSGRRRTGTRAVQERERGVEAGIGGEFLGCGEIGLGLARKADDEVRGKADPRLCLAQAAHDRAVFERGVAALHRGQYAVRAGLHRQMDVRRELVERGVRVDQALREVARVGCGVAHALDVELAHVMQQLGKIGRLAIDRAAPGIHVLAEQRHFPYALLHQAGRSPPRRPRTGATLPRRACRAPRRSCSTCCSLP